MPRGWFSGPGIGVLDTRYLRLNAVNDPVTAGLEINAATLAEPVLILQTTDDDATNPILEIQNAAGNMLSELEVSGNWNFTTALAANPGIIEVNNTRFFHNYGTDCLFIGLNAGNFTFIGDGLNVGIGSGVLASLTDGDRNVGIGWGALADNTSGEYNMAIGSESLNSNTTGVHNVGVGTGTLVNNLGGQGNVAIGSYTLQSNTTGTNNTGVGAYCLQNNIVASGNVAIGPTALNRNTHWNNIGIGQSAGYFKQDGNQNIFIGSDAGKGTANHGKDNNVMIGHKAGFVSMAANNNIFIGWQAGDVVTTGDNNIIIGYDIDPTGAAVSNELNIGSLIYGKLDTNRGGVNVTPPNLLATWHVDQPVDDAAIPVIILDQADISEGFINFIGSDRGVITGATNSVGSVRAEINGVVYRLALYADA